MVQCNVLPISQQNYLDDSYRFFPAKTLFQQWSSTELRCWQHSHWQRSHLIFFSEIYPTRIYFMSKKVPFDLPIEWTHNHFIETGPTFPHGTNIKESSYLLPKGNQLNALEAFEVHKHKNDRVINLDEQTNLWNSTLFNCYEITLNHLKHFQRILSVHFPDDVIIVTKSTLTIYFYNYSDSKQITYFLHFSFLSAFTEYQILVFHSSLF